MMNSLSRAVRYSEETVSYSSLAVDLVKLFRKRIMYSSMVFVLEIAKEGETNMPDSEVLLAVVTSGYMLAGYILTLRDVDLEKDKSENWESIQEDCSNYLLFAALGWLEEGRTVMC